MAGIVNDVLYALNSDFTGGNSLLASESNGLVTNGKMWIGSTALNAGGTHINVGSVTSPSATLTVGYVSPNITMEVTGAEVGKVLQGNGVGSPPVYSTSTYPSTAGTSGNILTSDGTNWTSAASSNVVLSVSGSLTNAQIKALNASPAVIVPAPGAGKVIKVISAVGKLVYGGTNAFTNAGGSSILLTYGAVGALATNFSLLPNAVITSTATTTTINNVTPTSALSASAATFDNIALTAWNASPTEIAGNAANNNTISYTVTYTIVTI